MDPQRAVLRVAMYSHDTFGLGHITRTLRLAQTIVDATPTASVLVLTGSPIANRLAFPRRVEYVKLPSVRKSGPASYKARDLAISFARLRQMRALMLRDSIQMFRPHLLFVDNVPHGMKGEMLPALEVMAARKQRGARVHLNLRDVLDDPAAIRTAWNASGVYATLREVYDEIHVFGDREVHDAVDAYELPPAKTTFLGYIAPKVEREVPAPNDRPRVLATIGGGDDGGENLLHAIAAQRLAAPGRRYDLDVVLGPFCDPALRAWIANEIPSDGTVRVRDYIEGLARSMSRYDLVLSMGGYNTLAEVMALARRSVVIPRVRPRREQELRARALSERGVLRWVHPDACAPESLEAEIRASLESGPLLPCRNAPPLDGLCRFRTRIRELAEEILGRAARPAAPKPKPSPHRKPVGAGRRSPWMLLLPLLALLSPFRAGAGVLPPEGSVELLYGYDTNILNASDAEVRAFETHDPGSYFVIRRLQDAAGVLTAEGRWATRLAGHKTEARLGYQRLQYVHETIRNENHYSLLLRTRFGEQTTASFDFELAPDLYGRHRRDKDALPGDPMFRPEVRTEYDAGLTLERALGPELFSRIGLEVTVRDFNEPFNERDRFRIGGMSGFSWRSDRVRWDMNGGYRRLTSRNDPYLGSDLSYREWTLRSAVECARCFGAPVRLRAQARHDWTHYTSSDPTDNSHFGREDGEWELGAGARYALTTHLDWEAVVARAWRQTNASLSAAFSDEEGAFHDTFVTTGLAWRWTR